MHRALGSFAAFAAFALHGALHAQPSRGGFDIPRDYFGGMVSGDFDGDRDLDLMFLEGNAARAHVFVHGDDGQFSEAHDFDAGIPFSARTADFDADGHDDIALSNLAVRSILVAYGDPDSRFSDVRNVNAPIEVRDFSVAD